MRKGERTLDGRVFILFNAMTVITDDDETHLAREVAAAKAKWERVRVIRGRFDYRRFVYVFGEK